MYRVSRSVTKWTPEMERELLNLWDYGVHKSEIAQRMGVSISTVEARYHKLNKLRKMKGQENG